MKSTSRSFHRVSEWVTTTQATDEARAKQKKEYTLNCFLLRKHWKLYFLIYTFILMSIFPKNVLSEDGCCENLKFILALSEVTFIIYIILYPKHGTHTRVYTQIPIGIFFFPKLLFGWYLNREHAVVLGMDGAKVMDFSFSRRADPFPSSLTIFTVIWSAVQFSWVKFVSLLPLSLSRLPFSGNTQIPSNFYSPFIRTDNM